MSIIQRRTTILGDIEDIQRKFGCFREENEIKQMEKLLKEIISWMNETPSVSYQEFDKKFVSLKREYKSFFKISDFNFVYRALINKDDSWKCPAFENLCVKKSCRSNSGVVVISVFTSPDDFSCPEKCAFCPEEKEEETYIPIMDVWKEDGRLVFKISPDAELENKDLVTPRSSFFHVISAFRIGEDLYENTCFIRHPDHYLYYCHPKESDLNEFYEEIKRFGKVKAFKSNQPKSYISYGPSVIRANQNRFDPYLQFYDRALCLQRNGHVIDKIEIIILGGTWSYHTRPYKDWFTSQLYYAANTFYEMDRTKVRPMYSSLEEEIRENERAQARIIGYTIETRPDFITPTECKILRSYGVTRIQMGVQHLDPAILDFAERNHYRRHVVKALYLAKKFGFKTDIHLMLDLPTPIYSYTEEGSKLIEKYPNLRAISSPDKDMEMLKTVLEDPDLLCDQYKIYPLEITDWTKFKTYYDNDEIKLYGNDEGGQVLYDVIKWFKIRIPHTRRLMRIIRDFPLPCVKGGNSQISMRDKLQADMKKGDWCCRCIRCREVKDRDYDDSGAEIRITEEYGNQGKEYFIEYVKPGKQEELYGFLRLRIDDEIGRQYLPELIGCAKIRELHVYGRVAKVSSKTGGTKKTQHRGVGTMLMKKAEEIVRAHKISKIAIIAGVGAREYYRKFGYVLDQGKGGYMIKDFNWERDELISSILKWLMILMMVVIFVMSGISYKIDKIIFMNDEMCFF